MKLSDIRIDTELSKAFCAQYPGSHCAFFGVAGMIPLIKNSYALLVGPEICLYNAKLTISIRTRTSDPRPDNLLLLPINQNDVIFGANQKVKSAIIEVDRSYKPEVLFVVTTCVQEIIGEDFDTIITSIQPEVNAKLLVIHTDNFTCKDLVPGIENTYLALAELMDHQPVKEKTVNILGLRIPNGRKTELITLLENKGVDVLNIIPSFSSPSDISRASGAKLNIVLEHHALPLAIKMRDLFGTEYVYCEKPYAIESVEKWYTQIAESLHIDINQEIGQLKENVQRKMPKIKEMLSGKTCAIGTIPGRKFDLTKLLINLGMKPVLFYIDRIIPDDITDIQILLNKGIDEAVIKGDNYLQNRQILAHMKPDYFIGFYNDHEELARLNIQTSNLLFSQFYLGFSCIDEILSLLITSPRGYQSLCYKEQLLLKMEAG